MTTKTITPKAKPLGQSMHSKTRRRKASLGRCPKCRAWILRGDDNDWAAWQVSAEPAFLTWAGEIAAVMFESRRTFTLDPRGRLNSRDDGARTKPARDPCVAEHVCGQPVPDPWKAILPTITKENDQCPF